MNSINKIELAGYVGSIRITTCNGTQIAKFTVATNFTYKSRSGETIEETTWHSCTAFGNSKLNCLDKIRKGTSVHLTGRIRNNRYTGPDGTERAFIEILVNELEIEQ